MRRLALILALLSAGTAAAQTTTFNGIVKDLSNTPVPTGQVVFNLKPGIDTTTTGSSRFVPSTTFCEIHNPSVVSTSGTGTITVVVSSPQTWLVGDSLIFVGTGDATLNGSSVAVPYTITLVNSTTSFNFTQSGTHANGAGGTVGGLYASGGTGGCKVIQNTALTPAGTSYNVGIQAIFAQTASFNTYAIGSGPVDISTIVPTPGQMPAYSFMDTFSNQSIGGIKTFTGTVNLNGGGALSGIFGGPTTLSGPTTATGDLLAKSGRPWYDVMAFGAKNDGTTDDTAAINAAITAACATTPPGGIIYFPKGAGYKIANIGITPFTIPCFNITLRGTGYSMNDVPTPPSGIFGNSLTVPLIIVGNGSCGFRLEDLYLQGNLASSGAIALQGTASGTCGAVVSHNLFDQWGGQCILTATTTSTWWITDNFAQNCLGQRNTLVSDTGGFDLGNNDIELHHNFVSSSTGLASGYLTAHPNATHAYGIVLRGTGGFASFNMGEISAHGWLLAPTSNFISFLGNRALLNQGNGLHNQGTGHNIVGFKSLTNSQDTTNTYDGYLCDNFCSGNTISDSVVDDTAGGNGNHQRHGFTDANGNGPLNETTRNKYSNNRLGSGPLGVKYNFTGINFPAVVEPHNVSADRGDNNVTLQCGFDAETQQFATPLTATRTVTFSATGAWNGCHFKIIRLAAASTNFPIGTAGCTTCSNLAPGTSIDVEFLNNNTWTQTASSECCTVTGDNAAAGNLAEYVQSVIATGSSVSLSTGTTANITSISLTAGDWDVTGVCDYTFGATTSFTNLTCGVSSTSATLGGQDSGFDFETPAEVPTAGADMSWAVPIVRKSLSSTTTIFLVTQATFTVSTLKAYGTIRARRVR